MKVKTAIAVFAIFNLLVFGAPYFITQTEAYKNFVAQHSTCIL